MEFDITELIGYFASALILLSFFMKELRTLRIVNSVGCAFFVFYGVMLGSYPIIITNVAIIFVNFFYLFLKKKNLEMQE